ncbi:MarR family transcriptional regulator [Pseudonocardia hispaniensis]|uniref:MarR family transcriptional regulator n=1 Tax=Pseudonocardia hispaniensis TaxID=904933 RepID=A0ABW1J397_9PSEU
MYMSNDNKPIGWWLRYVDGLIERGFETALADEGATRRQWQVLNVLAGGAADVAAVEAALAPFLTADGAAEAVLAELVARGWARTDGPAVALTPDGAAARERMTTAVRRHRARTVRGIDEREYAALVATLRRMADNLT